MRAVFLLLGAGTLLAGCSPGPPQQAQSSPPSIAYRVPGNDAAATNEQAQNYCAHYGHAAQYRGDEPDSSGGEVAVYTCDGAPASPGAAATPPAISSGSSTPPAPSAPVSPPVPLKVQ
jgi:hypothetical protein